MFNEKEFTIAELIQARNSLRNRIHEIEHSYVDDQQANQHKLNTAECTELLLLIIPEIKRQRRQALSELAQLSQESGEY